MIVVTAFNGFMCWLQDSELLALYAIVGGFSTPLLLSNGENHEVTLFSYLLVLNVAVLVLLVLRPWSRLLFGAFTGTVLFFSDGRSVSIPTRSLGKRHSFCQSSFLSLRLHLDWCACRTARSHYRVRMPWQWLGYLCSMPLSDFWDSTRCCNLQARRGLSPG